MIEVKGKYNTAIIFTDDYQDNAVEQVRELCDQAFTKNEKIRVMPDYHPGMGSTIGTTMTVTDKIVPNLVGVDIGCGMSVAFVQKGKGQINYEKLDDVIRKNVPSGFNIHPKKNQHRFVEKINLDNIHAPVNQDRAEGSIGTLGGGNHFIEINEVSESTVALVVHSGSRNLGKQIAEHYQKIAYQEVMDVNRRKHALETRLRNQGIDEEEIQQEIRSLKKPDIKRALAFLENESFDRYLNDMAIAQKFAELNRQAMIDIIVTKMGWEVSDAFSTIHNYIDMEEMILRKGAISAQKGERVIIPINMRDGSIIAYGKGNPDWNFSGPHGAGRLMSRTEAKKKVDFKDFKSSMKDVWSTSVKPETLDESPFVYKDVNDIIKNTTETIEIEQVIKPVYNFKA